MNTTLPQKRRALAPIEPNTRSSLGNSRPSPSKSDSLKSKMALGTSHVESSIKPPTEQENGRDVPGATGKKRRLSGLGAAPLLPRNETRAQKDDEDVTRPRSTSPEDPSVFDSSASIIDNSHVTIITEPDLETPAAAPAPTEGRLLQGSMTREEARRKAEILRLRLGLASYKVKTNQADVPLERLQVRPVPGKMLRQMRSAASLPPLPTASRRRALPVLRPEAEKASGSGARGRGASVPKSSAKTSSQKSRGPSSSVAVADVNKSPVKKREPERTVSSPPAIDKTQKELEQDEGILDSERGGAAEGLLSLSQGSPGPCLK
ncbi:hypothetical protein GGS21DRAFT_179058 [Xylaria nigripes]|nr:hypothetical protein GGS21DRAFT_179058 [Xylaria nigripes]